MYSLKKMDEFVHFDKLSERHATGYAKLMHAIHFAAIKHSEQRRKDPQATPYINHPIGVAHILMTLGGLTKLDGIQPTHAEPDMLDALSTVLAAILHDTVEDTECTFEEIEKEFGQRVRSIVEECTDDKSLSKEERKLKQVQMARGKSREAKAVKLADKLYNLRDLTRAVPIGWYLPIYFDDDDDDGRSAERVQEYFEWAKKVVDGCRGVLPGVERELDRLFLTPST